MPRDDRTARAGMRRHFSSIYLAAAIALASALPAGAASASSIKMVVNDQAITQMDIQGRTRLLQVAGHLSAGAAAKQAREELIDEAVRMQAAKSRGVIVPEARVDQAIANLASHSKMNPSQFAGALASTGVPIETLRARIRAQMAWAEIVRARLRQQIRADNADLIAQMRNREKAADSVTAFDYLVQKVVFIVPKGTAAAAAAARKRDAEALRGKFRGCAEGLAFAKGLKDVAVVNVGRKLAGEVPPQLRDDFLHTDEGRLTPPQPSDYGFEMYAICEKTPVTGESAVGASGLNVEALNKQGEELSAKMTQELRQQAKITIR